MKHVAICAAALTFSPFVTLQPESRSAADDPIRIEPGGTLVRAGELETYSARWRQRVRAADGSEREGINIITDEVSIRAGAGKPESIVRDLLWESASGTYRRVDTLDRQTLAPIHMDVAVSPHSVSHVDFDGTRLRAVSIPGPARRATMTEVELGAPAFNWSSDGFLLAALQLDGQTDVEIPVVNDLSGAPRVDTKTFTVLGREDVETIPFGAHDAFVVKETGTGGYWGQYWVSEFPPYVVRVQFTQADGSVTTWELF